MTEQTHKHYFYQQAVSIKDADAETTIGGGIVQVTNKMSTEEHFKVIREQPTRNEKALQRREKRIARYIDDDNNDFHISQLANWTYSILMQYHLEARWTANK